MPGHLGSRYPFCPVQKTRGTSWKLSPKPPPGVDAKLEVYQTAAEAHCIQVIFHCTASLGLVGASMSHWTRAVFPPSQLERRR